MRAKKPRLGEREARRLAALLLRQAGWTQRETAEALGLSQQRVDQLTRDAEFGDASSTDLDEALPRRAAAVALSFGPLHSGPFCNSDCNNVAVAAAGGSRWFGIILIPRESHYQVAVAAAGGSRWFARSIDSPSDLALAGERKIVAVAAAGGSRWFAAAGIVSAIADTDTAPVATVAASGSR